MKPRAFLKKLIFFEKINYIIKPVAGYSKIKRGRT